MEFSHLKIIRVLTLLLAFSLTIVSIAGAFFPATYARDAASMAAQGVGQDMVDLLGDMYAGDPDFGFTDMEVDYDGKDVTAEVYGIMKQVSFIKLMGGSGDG